MSEKEYLRKVNRNILNGWIIISSILLFSYIIEIIKGLRTVSYVLVFSAIMLIPIGHSMYLYFKYKGQKSLMIPFILGYGALYTFVMFTSETPITFVYILPMVSLIIVYGNKMALLCLYTYALVINMISILLQNTGKLDLFTVLESFKGKMTFWEIQVACMALTGVFVYQSCSLLMKRNEVILELRDDVHNDGLTGLKNVRFLEEHKEDLFRLNNFSNISVAFLDIDDFKNFNTKYGHAFGDEVLKAVAFIMMQATIDISNTYAIRNGGDEFLIVSTALNPEEFIKLSKSLCTKIRALKLPYKDEQVSVTVSVGVATRNDYEEMEEFMDIYNLADSRNDQAKREGKNRVVYD